MHEQKTVHFVGIGGIGMSALAHILLQRGTDVSGSDIAPSYVLEALQHAGARIAIGHKREPLKGASQVVYSTAVTMDNPEFQAAAEWGIPLIHRADLLAELMAHSTALLVAGTHGKTTTSSLLSHLLVEAGFDPSFAVGGIVRSLGTNGKHGKGPYFVAEADESDGSFLKYRPFGAIVTNIDNDHIDYWKSTEGLIQGFLQFCNQVNSSEHLFWCRDDERLSSLELSGSSYGFHEQAHLHIQSFCQMGWKTYFTFTFDGKDYHNVELPLIGGHNVLNGSAVFGLALRLGIDEKLIRRALSSFQGVLRRAEKKGEKEGIQFFDDYAHHPTEILATTRAFIAANPGKRLVVVFQPHRYSRTKECLEQFPDAFLSVHELVITDIYSAGEAPLIGIDALALKEKIEAKTDLCPYYVPRDQLKGFLQSFLQPNDICLSMGAGDITKLSYEILNG